MTKIQLLREQQGLSRTELAQLAGLKTKDVREAEELNEMYVSEVLSIARALRVRPNTIRVVNGAGCFAREKKKW